jgi:hypothetical protein
MLLRPRAPGQERAEAKGGSAAVRSVVSSRGMHVEHRWRTLALDP